MNNGYIVSIINEILLNIRKGGEFPPFFIKKIFYRVSQDEIYSCTEHLRNLIPIINDLTRRC